MTRDDDHKKPRKAPREKRGRSGSPQRVAMSESSMTPSHKRSGKMSPGRIRPDTIAHKKSARCSPTVTRQDSTDTKIAKLVQQYPDAATIQVLTKLFEVFRPTESIFAHLKDGPVTALIKLVKATQLTYNQINDMFAKFEVLPIRPGASSSSRHACSASAATSSEKVRRRPFQRGAEDDQESSRQNAKVR